MHAIALRTAVIEAKIAANPKDSGVYNLVRTGAAAKPITCARPAPETNFITLLLKLALRFRDADEVIIFGLSWASNTLGKEEFSVFLQSN
jgi:hypothetical protein